jgi:hypothetical protein
MMLVELAGAMYFLGMQFNAGASVRVFPGVRVSMVAA